ncbi:hypothetical protein TWF106_003519 [Orbilia oligospora]|uniref:Srp40 C-terminal domain-containing protein n=1 Tax=Orbilia oligospora TaxID=2813651 RepID=A0A6G1LSC8_ORBOL|nr:hypothetical protein TWF679_004558 [Orbilia oligospora]KAF3199940.1 hypothetical protein TWF106_003519 [Orbilia oligospora]KAF3231699.1 hypothetical protein TWF192_003430 [Orbilia oligospora]
MADKAWIFKPSAAHAPMAAKSPGTDANTQDNQELLSLVSQYLQSNGFPQASRKLLRESEKRQIKIEPPKSHSLSLCDIYQRFRTTVVPASPSAQLAREAADDTSDTLSAKSAESSNVAKDSKPKNPRKRQRSSDESSDDSSSDSSDSDSESNKKKATKKPTKNTTPPRERKKLKLSTPAKELPHKGESKKATETLESENATPVLSTSTETKSESGKGEKVKNKPFSRINIEKITYEDDALKDNSFNGATYAQRAHEDLIVTRGKGFTKEKNKKKRGAYRGGAIDFAPKSYKFKD